MKDVLGEITRLRLARGWSEYDMAREAKLSQSTISTWYRKKQIPTIKSLEKICSGFGITLSQFFAEDTESVPLTLDQRKMLEYWSWLTAEQKALIIQLFQSIEKTDDDEKPSKRRPIR